MKKIMIGNIIMFFVLLFMHPAYAKGNVTQINSQ